MALLPAWARWPLRLPYLPVSETLVVRPAGQVVTQLIRWSLTPEVGPMTGVQGASTLVHWFLLHVSESLL